MVNVYLGCDMILDCDVVIKVFCLDFVSDDVFIKCFYWEV